MSTLRIVTIAFGVTLLTVVILVAPVPDTGSLWRPMAVLALAAAVLALLLADRQSARAVARLTEAAQAVAQGQAPQVVPTTRALTELARAIEVAGGARRAAEERLRLRETLERTARSAAEAEATRFSFLAEASRLLAASLDYGTFSALARLAAETIADWCVVDLVEPDGTIRRVAVAHADPSRAEVARALQLRHPPGPDGPATLREVLASGKSVLAPTLTPADVARRARNPEHLRLLGSLGIESMMIVPLVARRRIVGAITLVRGGGDRYGADDLRVAEELAHRTAMAVDSAQLYASVREARERFSRLVEHLDAIVWEADPVSLRFTFVSQRAQQILGYPVERWLEEPEFWSGIIHPDDRVACVERFTRSVRENADSRFEYRVVAADGRILCLENVVQATPDADTGAVRVRGFMLDVSERKRLEAEHQRLLESEQAARAEAEAGARRAKFLAEASQVLASSLEYDATLEAVTRLAVPSFADWCLVHLSEDEGQRVQAASADPGGARVGDALARVAGSPDLKSLLPALASLQAGTPLLVSEISPAWIEAVRLVQELKPRSVMIVPLVARGRELGTLTFVWSESGRRYDAADLALAEDLARRAAVAVDNARLYGEAERANRTKDEFLATLSHELRTPLTAMLGWVLGLRTGRLGPEQTGRALESLERNTRHQAKLIDDLLDVSRITAGKFTLDRRPLDFREVIELTIDSIRPDLATKQLDLSWAPPPTEMLVPGDPMRLQQVVLNLLSNAVKFTPTTGRIAVTLARDGMFARLTVADTGEGIEPEVLPHVFETFRQADGTNTRQHSGLGLGLAIVKRLVELHGGHVEARSEGRGHGAVFTVTLPILAKRASIELPEVAAESRRAPSADLPRLDGIRVLVVDDQADTRELVESLLSERGAVVLQAASAAEALSTIETTYVDVLLSDIGMPDTSGYELIRRVRERERAHGGRLPAVALTAYAGREARELALTAGFEQHVTKPITPADLVEIVAKAAGRS